MLQSLTIQNFALIDNTVIDFRKGFTVITGETGSGKSILLGALSLLLGERAESKQIYDKSRKTIVEAVFTSPGEELKAIFEEQELEWNDEEILVRREISSSGRSRAFINDTPVTLPVLASVTGNLVDIHSQHSNVVLSNVSSHLSIIDAFCGNSELLGRYKETFGKYVTLRAKIRKIKEQNERNKDNREFIAFQLEQLDKIKPKEGELVKIEQQFDMLSDADQIKENLGNVYSLLEASENSSLSQISEAKEMLGKVNISLFDKDGNLDLIGRLENIQIELRDISETIRDFLDQTDSDPKQLEIVTSRMNVIYDAIKRFKVLDEYALVKLHKELKHKLNAIDFGDDDVAGLEQEAKVLARSLKAMADELSESRMDGAKKFPERLVETARPLGLHNLQFEVVLTQGKLTSDGQDAIEFRCTFNKSHALSPIAKVASGGEMARLMLSIKSIMAKRMNLPTVIFDEVDTGVSGDIADRMGMMMKDMSKDMQVIAITHLPQVAARGCDHLKVYKQDEGNRTVSHVMHLSNDERIKEIASMLSGATVNEAARSNAMALLEESLKQ